MKRGVTYSGIAVATVGCYKRLFSTAPQPSYNNKQIISVIIKRDSTRVLIFLTIHYDVYWAMYMYKGNFIEEKTLDNIILFLK